MAIGPLLERMAGWAGAPAVAWGGETFTYGELLETADLWGRRLEAFGLAPRRVVAFEGDYSPDTCALLLALAGQGAVAVPLSPASAAHRETFLDIAEARALFRFEAGGLWSLERRDGEVENPLTRTLIEEGEPGLILFTSGSTGAPKASLHHLGRFLGKFLSPRAPLRTVAVPPMDHTSGLDTLFYTLSSGGMLVCPPDRSPEAVCRAVELYRAELLPASATFLNLLLISEAWRRHDLSSLKVVAYGSEVMPERTLGRLREVLPESRFLQKYGMTELGSPRTRSREDGSLWVKIESEGVETKVVDGVLWVRAASAMVGYLNAPSPFDEEGWLNTEDMVEVEGEYVRFLGRRTEVINVGGEKVYPAEVEGVLLQMDNVRDATVWGEANPILGHIVAAKVDLFEPEEPSALKRRIRAFCRERLPGYKVPATVEVDGGGPAGGRFKKVRAAAGGQARG